MHKEKWGLTQSSIFTMRATTFWASYRGGTVRAGWLIGIVSGDRFKFRYVHLNLEGGDILGAIHGSDRGAR